MWGWGPEGEGVNHDDSSIVKLAAGTVFPRRREPKSAVEGETEALSLEARMTEDGVGEIKDSS